MPTVTDIMQGCMESWVAAVPASVVPSSHGAFALAHEKLRGRRSQDKTGLGVAQALSKRIHYGKFVAEAKFLANREEYSSLIRQQDADGLMRLLTDEAVEAKVPA